MLLWTVDLLMVGRLGVVELNAVSLGRLWLMGTALLAMGVLFGVDPLAAQAYGARDEVGFCRVRKTALRLAVWVSLPVAALWLATGPVLRLFGQSPETVELARLYVWVQLPGLPCLLAFVALRQVIQATGNTAPAFLAALLANGFNFLANWILIFGKLGCPALGVVGAGLASLGTEVVLLVLLVLLSRKGTGSRLALRKDGCPGARADWVAVVRLGLPISLQMTLEYWAFAWSTLVAGRLGGLELAAHTIAMNLASLSYMVPLGISQAAAIRVGNRIGANEPAGARESTLSALALGAGVMALFSLAFIVFPWKIPELYGVPPEVIGQAAAILPIVAAFELFDGLQVVGAGALRGMGRTRPAAWANLLGYYALALPAAGLLAGPGGLGLRGLWWGLALGLFAVALAVAVYLLRCTERDFAPLGTTSLQ
jgi:MATE family multidrug resistance protein